MTVNQTDKMINTNLIMKRVKKTRHHMESLDGMVSMMWFPKLKKLRIPEKPQ